MTQKVYYFEQYYVSVDDKFENPYLANWGNFPESSKRVILHINDQHSKAKTSAIFKVKLKHETHPTN